MQPSGPPVGLVQPSMPTPSPYMGNSEEEFMYSLKQANLGDEFWMYSFKVVTCPHTHRHNWTFCPYAHLGETAQRRCPRTYSYTADMCPKLKMGGMCPDGLNCCFSHNLFEQWLHPSRYRTRLCYFGEQCTRASCFFAHSPTELRTVEDPALDGLPAWARPPVSHPRVTVSVVNSMQYVPPPPRTAPAAAGWSAGMPQGAAGVPTGTQFAAAGLPTGTQFAAAGVPTGTQFAQTGIPTGTQIVTAPGMPANAVPVAQAAAPSANMVTWVPVLHQPGQDVLVSQAEPQYNIMPAPAVNAPRAMPMAPPLRIIQRRPARQNHVQVVLPELLPQSAPIMLPAGDRALPSAQILLTTSSSRLHRDPSELLDSAQSLSHVLNLRSNCSSPTPSNFSDAAAAFDSHPEGFSFLDTHTTMGTVTSDIDRPQDLDVSMQLLNLLQVMSLNEAAPATDDGQAGSSVSVDGVMQQLLAAAKLNKDAQVGTDTSADGVVQQLLAAAKPDKDGRPASAISQQVNESNTTAHPMDAQMLETLQALANEGLANGQLVLVDGQLKLSPSVNVPKPPAVVPTSTATAIARTHPATASRAPATAAAAAGEHVASAPLSVLFGLINRLPDPVRGNNNHN